MTEAVHPFHKVFLESLLFYLKREHEEARRTISTLRRTADYQPFRQKLMIALIERDLDAAVDNFVKAVDANEPAVFFWHNNTCFLNRVFPEFVAYPPYQEALRDIGLDAESTATIQIPDLPF